MTTEHDEALVERVALALARAKYGQVTGLTVGDDNQWRIDARAVIYPPAPPKTRLEVARELLASEDAKLGMGKLAEFRIAGRYDNDAETAAVMAALALPQMED